MIGKSRSSFKGFFFFINLPKIATSFCHALIHILFSTQYRTRCRLESVLTYMNASG